MFDSLKDKLQDVFSGLGKRGALREADVDAALREVRLALDVYRQGRSDGIAVGRSRAQADIRKALGL